MMGHPPSTRADREISHGASVAQGDPEAIWGWATPAGKARARRRAALIAEGACLAPGVRALEIGCGTGLFTEMFAETGAVIDGVDISPELLARAQARGLPADRVRFLVKRFEDFDAGGAFDAVIGSSVLHHLDMDLAAPKIAQLLKPGGWMSFAEPNMVNPQIAVQKNVGWVKRRLGDSPDETAFVRWSLRRTLEGVGLEQVEIRPFDWLHPLTPAALIRTVSTCGHILERIPIVREFAGSLLIRGRRPGSV